MGYHKVECYVNFRSKHWEALEENKEEVHCESNLTSSKDYLQSIIELIRLHVIARKEVYTLTDIRKAYEIIKTDSSPKLRVGDIKAIIVEEFENEILVQEGCYQNKKNEYVFPASFTLTSDVLEAAAKGYGISTTASIRSTANRLHYSLISSQKNRPWPPTPQDIIKDKDPYQIDLFNFIAWLVDPSAPVGKKDGIVKLRSNHKARKIGEICCNIESLLPNGQPSFDQILFSLVFHRNTGKREPIDIAHGYGYGISYSEVCFIEDSWEEWDRAQNSNIPPNIKKQHRLVQ